MIITLPAEITVTGESECAELTIHRPSIMVESRTPTLVTYSFICGDDDGLTEWLAEAADLFDPRLFVHVGFDGIELAIKAVPAGMNELHEFPLDVKYSDEEALALAALAFPNKKFDRVYSNCRLRRATPVNALRSRSERF